MLIYNYHLAEEQHGIPINLTEPQEVCLRGVFMFVMPGEPGFGWDKSSHVYKIQLHKSCWLQML